MKRTYSDRKQWVKTVFNLRTEGYLFIGVGILFALLFNMLYLGDKVGLYDLDVTKHEQLRQPPGNQLLYKLLVGKTKPLVQPKTNNPFGGSSQPETAAPRSTYLFGTNRQGYELLTLIVYGSTAFALPGLLSVAIAICLGVGFGIMDGYTQGWGSWFSKKTIHLIHAIPRLLILIIVGIIFNFNIYAIMICLGILNFPKVAQSISTKVQHLKQQQFIEAAIELGLSKWSIIFEQILWSNCRYIIFIQAAFGMADAIFTETTLSYLELGAHGADAVYRSWGRMLVEGADYINQGEYWHSAIPAICVVITILGYYLIGDGLSRVSRITD